MRRSKSEKRPAGAILTSEMTNGVRLGDTVVDDVTGFTGIVICVSLWLNGCARISVQPRGLTKDGRVKESETIDAGQLRVLKSARPLVKGDGMGPGGPTPNPVGLPAAKR